MNVMVMILRSNEVVHFIRIIIFYYTDESFCNDYERKSVQKKYCVLTLQYNLDDFNLLIILILKVETLVIMIMCTAQYII